MEKCYGWLVETEGGAIAAGCTSGEAGAISASRDSDRDLSFESDR